MPLWLITLILKIGLHADTLRKTYHSGISWATPTFKVSSAPFLHDAHSFFPRAPKMFNFDSLQHTSIYQQAIDGV